MQGLFCVLDIGPRPFFYFFFCILMNGFPQGRLYSIQPGPIVLHWKIASLLILHKCAFRWVTLFNKSYKQNYDIQSDNQSKDIYIAPKSIIFAEVKLFLEALKVHPTEIFVWFCVACDTLISHRYTSSVTLFFVDIFVTVQDIFIAIDLWRMSVWKTHLGKWFLHFSP